jgi:hypothetical protein
VQGAGRCATDCCHASTGTASALRPARLVHRPRAMMRAARVELGSIERHYPHSRALQARLDGTVAQVRQFRFEIVS